MEASSNQPPPPSKQQQQLYVADGSAWLWNPSGPKYYQISLLFAVLIPIVFFSIAAGESVIPNGTGIIIWGLATSLCYLISLVTAVIGRRRVKRDPDLKGNKFNTLYLTLLTIVNFFNTWIVLFIWVDALPGELNGGCC